MRLPVIITVAAAHVDSVNAIFEAMGKGANTVTVKCCSTAIADPTHETPASHYIAQDMSATDSDVAEWQAMTSGSFRDDLSSLWGRDGLLTLVAARVACMGGNMTVASEAGLDTNEERESFLSGILIGKGLQLVPDPPVI